MKDILIVEDGTQERERLQQLFANAGYAVEACESVGEAETALQSESFRLAVLDIGLNDKSGSYLFNKIKQSQAVSYVLIFTGNPSVHLKQRFLDEGAVDYIVKGSPQAQNDSFLDRVAELLGDLKTSETDGIPLGDLLAILSDKSRQLFLNADGSVPACAQCSANSYLVSFNHETQVPPDVSGRVVCAQCGAVMDPEIQ